MLEMNGDIGKAREQKLRDRQTRRQERKEAMIRELGDVLWYVATTAEALNAPLETVMQVNIDKLRARYPMAFDAERSQHREEGDT